MLAPPPATARDLPRPALARCRPLSPAASRVVPPSSAQFNATAIHEAGALSLLVQLASSPSPSVQLQAVWALANVAVDEDVKRALYELRAVPVLVRRLEAPPALA